MSSLRYLVAAEGELDLDAADVYATLTEALAAARHELEPQMIYEVRVIHRVDRTTLDVKEE